MAEMQQVQTGLRDNPLGVLHKFQQWLQKVGLQLPGTQCLIIWSFFLVYASMFLLQLQPRMPLPLPIEIAGALENMDDSELQFLRKADQLTLKWRIFNEHVLPLAQHIQVLQQLTSTLSQLEQPDVPGDARSEQEAQVWGGCSRRGAAL